MNVQIERGLSLLAKNSAQHTANTVQGILLATTTGYLTQKAAEITVVVSAHVAHHVREVKR